MDKTLQKRLEIAKRIAFLLKSKGWKQKDLADITELGEPSISAILKGGRNLELDTIVRMETALNAKIIMIPKD